MPLGRAFEFTSTATDWLSTVPGACCTVLVCWLVSHVWVFWVFV